MLEEHTHAPKGIRNNAGNGQIFLILGILSRNVSGAGKKGEWSELTSINFFPPPKKENKKNFFWACWVPQLLKAWGFERWLLKVSRWQHHKLETKAKKSIFQSAGLVTGPLMRAKRLECNLHVLGFQKESLGSCVINAPEHLELCKSHRRWASAVLPQLGLTLTHFLPGEMPSFFKKNWKQ